VTKLSYKYRTKTKKIKLDKIKVKRKKEKKIIVCTINYFPGNGAKNLTQSND